MRDKLESENKHENGSIFYNINYGLVFGILGTTAAIGSFYYTRKEYKTESKSIDKNREDTEDNHVEIKHKPPKKYPYSL